MKKYRLYLLKGLGIFLAVFVAKAIDRAAGLNIFEGDISWQMFMWILIVTFIGSLIGDLLYRLTSGVQRN